MRPTNVPVADSEELAAALGDVVDDYLARRAAGQRPNVSVFADQHPEIAELIRQSLRALEVVGDTVASADQELAENSFDTPKTLGDFRILGELGRGGMGVVYEAEQISLGRKVALKVLPFAGMVRGNALQRFQNEVRAAASLDHPHIVSVYSVGEERGVHYYAMQLIRGQSLAEVISQLVALQRENVALTDRSIVGVITGCQPSSHRDVDLPMEDSRRSAGHPSSKTTRRVVRGEAETSVASKLDGGYYQSVARLIGQAAEALAHAHDNGVLHRDIKPGNLMPDASMQLYVTDFGLARIESDAGMTMTGDLIGTLRYISPEQAKAQTVIDHRADIYSLGVTLYELLTLRPAFVGSDRHDLLQRIVNTEPEPPRRINSAIPRDLETIVLKASAKHPNARYQTAEDLAEDLRRFDDDRPIRARRPTLIERGSRRLRRHRGLATATALTAVLALIVSTIVVSIKQSETSAALFKSVQDNRRAERNLQIARDAINQLYDELPTTAHAAKPALQDSQRESLEKAARFYEQLGEINGDSPGLRFDSALAWKRVGAIRIALRQFGPAETALRRSVLDLDALVLNPDHPPRFDRERAYAIAELAVAKRMLRDFGAAEKLFLSAISLLDSLSRENEMDNELKSFLAQTQREYGLLLSNIDRLDDAEKVYRSVLPLQQQVVDVDSDHAVNLASLSDNYHDLGNILGRRGRYGEAIECLERAVELQKQVIQVAPDEHAYLDHLALSYADLDGWLEDVGEQAKALAAKREELLVRFQLVRRFPSIGSYSQDLFLTAETLVDRTGDPASLLEADQVLAEAYAAISISSSTAEFVISAKAEILFRRAQIASRFGDGDRSDGAENMLRDLIAQLRQTVAETPDRIGYREILAETLRDLTALLTPAQRFSESIDLILEEIKISEFAPKGIENVEQRALLVHCYERLAFVCHFAHDFEQAIDAWAKTVELREQLVDEFPDDPDRKTRLFSSYDAFGSTLNRLNRHVEAEKVYRHALETHEVIERSNPQRLVTPATPYRLVELFGGLAESLDRQGKSAEAAKAFQLGMLVVDRALATRDSFRFAEFYHGCAWRLATSQFECCRDLQRALRYAQHAVELDPDSHVYWNTLGIAQFYNDQFGDAVESLTKSKQLGHTDAYNDLFIAMCYWQLGDAAQAAMSYELATNLLTNESSIKFGLNEELQYSVRDQTPRFFAEGEALLGIPASESAIRDIPQPSMVKNSNHR